MRETTENFFIEEHEEIIRKYKKKNRWIVYYEVEIHQNVRNDFKSFIKVINQSHQSLFFNS